MRIKKADRSPHKILLGLSLIPGILATAITICYFFLKEQMDCFVTVLPDWLKWSITVFVSICLILNIFFTLRKPYKRHEFDYGSEKYISFFKNWYSQKGKIYVVCDDIDWTCQGNDERIYTALLQKAMGNQLTLFLDKGKTHNENVIKLKESGAKVNIRPNSISKYAFSFLEVMGNTANKAILRNKDNDPEGKVIFEERNDEFLRLLLETVVEQGTDADRKKKR